MMITRGGGGGGLAGWPRRWLAGSLVWTIPAHSPWADAEGSTATTRTTTPRSTDEEDYYNSILRGWRPLIEATPPPPFKFCLAGRAAAPAPAPRHPPAALVGTPVSQGADETGVPGARGLAERAGSRPRAYAASAAASAAQSVCCACHPADAGMMRMTGRQGQQQQQQQQDRKKNGAAVRAAASSGPGLFACVPVALVPLPPLCTPQVQYVHGARRSEPFVLLRRSPSPGAHPALSTLEALCTVQHTIRKQKVVLPSPLLPPSPAVRGGDWGYVVGGRGGGGCNTLSLELCLPAHSSSVV